MALDALGNQLSIAWDARDTRTVGFTSQTVPLVRKSYALPFTSGTGAKQFTKSYAAARTLPGATEDVDLAGVLTDPFGALITAARVVAWGVANTGDASLVVGGTGGSYWTSCLNGTLTLPPGAVCAFGTPDAAAWTVTAGTGDLLHVAGTSGKTYDLILWVSE